MDTKPIAMKKIIPLLAILVLGTQCQKELAPEFSNFADPRDGYTYQTVTLGLQTWFAENLRYLPTVHHLDDRSITEMRYYVFDYHGTNLDDAKTTSEYLLYGALYNYIAALSACPDGWHLPSEVEWKELTKTVGKNNGAALRSTHYWSSEMPGNNTSGFDLIPAPYQDGTCAWSTGKTTDVAGRVYVWGFPWSPKRLEHDDVARDDYSTIRCVKD